MRTSLNNIKTSEYNSLKVSDDKELANINISLKVNQEKLKHQLNTMVRDWDSGKIKVSDKSAKTIWQKQIIKDKLIELRQKYKDEDIYIENNSSLELDFIFGLLHLEYMRAVKIKKLVLSESSENSINTYGVNLEILKKDYFHNQKTAAQAENSIRNDQIKPYEYKSPNGNLIILNYDQLEKTTCGNIYHNKKPSKYLEPNHKNFLACFLEKGKGVSINYLEIEEFVGNDWGQKATHNKNKHLHDAKYEINQLFDEEIILRGDRQESYKLA